MNKKIDPAKIRGLAIDLDGTTLLPDTRLGERTRICLQKLIAKGMHIIISTGRAIESSERFRSGMGAEGPMVFFNGAEVADVPSGKILYANLISLDVADYGADVARDMGVHYQIYLQAGVSPVTGLEDPNQKWEALLIDSYGPEAQMYRNHTGIVPVVTDLKNIAKMPIEGCIKGMFIADPSKHDEIRSRMHERFGNSIHILRSFPTFLEVINTGVSKGAGLKVAMRHRGLEPQEVISFGDEENDLPMFEVTGFSAAPESARDMIKSQADFIFGSNAGEGLAAFLEDLFF